MIGCNIKKVFLEKILNSDGSHESQSMLLFGESTIDGNYTAIKLFDSGIDSLEYELKIYKKTINNIQKRYINFLKYISDCEFKLIDFYNIYIDGSPLKVKNKFLKQIQELFPARNGINWNVNIKCLFIESSESFTTFDQLINDNKRFSYFNVVYQVLFSLKVMESLELMHHDLHLGNVGIIPSKVVIEYNGNNLKIDYLVKIFDWDRGFDPNIKKQKNEYFNMYCENTGVCPIFSPNWDFLRFFGSLFENSSESQRNKLSKVLDIEYNHLLYFISWWDFGQCDTSLCKNSPRLFDKTIYKRLIQDVRNLSRKRDSPEKILSEVTDEKYSKVITDVYNKLTLEYAFNRISNVVFKKN